MDGDDISGAEMEIGSNKTSGSDDILQMEMDYDIFGMEMKTSGGKMSTEDCILQTELPVDHTYSVLSGNVEPNESHDTSLSLVHKFDAVIGKFMMEQGIPGAALVLRHNGKTVYKQGYGIAGAGRRMASSLMFRIASISKVITAIAVMKLYEEGKLSLQQQVFELPGSQAGRLKTPGHRWCEKLEKISPDAIKCFISSPEQMSRKAIAMTPVVGVVCRHPAGMLKISGCRWPKLLEKITVEHLLQHSAGWDRDKSGDQVFWYQDSKHARHIDGLDQQKLMEYVCCKPLQFAPGSQHAYSNFGYLVLGLVIEVVTGQNYCDYVQTLFSQVAGDELVVGQAHKHLLHLSEVEYFNNGDDLVMKSVYEDEGIVSPQYGAYPMYESAAYGGWVASATALANILDNLDFCFFSSRPHLLSESSVRLMLARPDYESGDNWYGYGLDVVDGKEYGHTGAMEGTSTTLHHDAQGWTWAFLCNAWAKDMDLDGLIKYAFSMTQMSTLQSLNETSSFNEQIFFSEDGTQCVAVLLPYAFLRSHIKHLKGRNYIIDFIHVFTSTRGKFVNIVWNVNKSGARWDVCVNVRGKEELAVCIRMYKTLEMSVHCLESYFVSGQLCYIIVFVKGPAVNQFVHYIVRSDKSLQANSSVSNSNDTSVLGIDGTAGVIPTTQTITSHNGRSHITCIFSYFLDNRQPHFKFLPCMLSDDFPSVLCEMTESKFGLVVCKFYRPTHTARQKTTGGGVHVSGLWLSDRYSLPMYRQDVSRYAFLYELKESLRKNVPVKCISSYYSDGVMNFAAVWQHKPGLAEK